MTTLTPRADSNEKNLIINGNMDFWQRGTSVAVSNTRLYQADRFCTSVNSSTYTITQSQSTDIPTVSQSNYQSRYSLLLTNGTGSSPASTDLPSIQYRMEGQDYQNIHGRHARLQFWVKSSVTGTYSLCLGNNGVTRTYITTYSITSANTWTKIALDFPLDTTGGAFDNTVGLYITFVLSAGSAVQSSTLNVWGTANVNGLSGANTQTNWAGTTSATFQLAQVSLIPQDFTAAGSSTVDVPFQRAGRSIGHELQMCQRYYEVNQSPYVWGINASSSPIFAAGNIRYAVVKRTNASPIITDLAGAVNNYSQYAPSTFTLTNGIGTATLRNPNTDGFSVTGTTTGTGSNNFAINWSIDAEL